MGSPTLWGPNNTSNNLQAAIGLSSGMRLDSNGAKNYITNYGAEVDTTGWATYADAAGNIPVDGTGGTATGLTFARSTSSPLMNIASFTMTQANSTNIQGKGVSYDFTIDSSMQAQVFSISFNYNASSTFVASNGTTPPLNDGTTSTNAGNSDVEVFIYDVSNGVLIPVSPQVITGNGTNNFQFKGIFQTSGNSTSYRLIFHVATSNANATGWTFKFDNVFCGPQYVVAGSYAGDFTNNYSFTPNNFGTVANAVYSSRRVGDSLEVTAKWTNGTTVAAAASLSLPSGLVIDSAKLFSSSANLGAVGVYYMMDTSANNLYTSFAGIVFFDGSDTSKIFFTRKMGTTSGQLDKENGSTIGVNSGVTIVKFTIPIAGWSSNMQMSQDAETRIVAARVYSGSVQSVNSATDTTLDIDTVTYDTHAAFNTSTNAYVVPVSGYYQVTSSIQWGQNMGAGSDLRLRLYKNGSFHSQLNRILSTPTDTQYFLTGTTTVNCVAGDSLTIVVYQSQGSARNLDNGSNTPTTFERISGPAAIAATETVSCRYSLAGTNNIPNTDTNTVIKFDTKTYDTHGAYSTSTGLFTAPVSGKYSIKSCQVWTGVNFSVVNQSVVATVYKNGSVYSTLSYYAAIVTEAFGLNLSTPGSDEVQLNAGDTIAVYARQSSNTSNITPATGSGFDAYVCITRVGN